MKPHSKTYNGFGGVDIETTDGIVIQGFSYTLSPSATSPHKMGVAGAIIFRDNCENLPKVFDIELTSCDALGQIMKKYIRDCKLINSSKPIEAFLDTQHTFIADRIEDWSVVEPPKTTRPEEWPPWGVDNSKE